MNKESILGIVRHILTFGGGFMTQNGMATQDDITTGVSATAIRNSCCCNYTLQLN